VAVGGKGANPKTTLYVGGLEESVNEAILHSAFIPFGDIKDVNIPMDHATGKHRGFGFVEFDSKEVRRPTASWLSECRPRAPSSASGRQLVREPACAGRGRRDRQYAQLGAVRARAADKLRAADEDQGRRQGLFTPSGARSLF